MKRRAKLKAKAQKRRLYRPAIPSRLMRNVNSLANNMDELTALIQNERSYRKGSLIILSETWLTSHTPDANVELPGFVAVRVDRNNKACGKSKGGGLVLSANNRWCNPGLVTVIAVLCCQELELLAVCPVHTVFPGSSHAP